MSLLKNTTTLLLSFFLTALILPEKSVSVDHPKYILIHLDAASSHYLQQEMNKGNLPNIKSYFGDEGRIDNTITYFPSKTPTVISSLRLGKSVREANLPGWEWIIDTIEEPVVLTAGTFLRMIFSKSRLSRTNIIYGIQAFHWLAGPALVNTAYYLKDYDVVQFYWYNIDTQGHFKGEEAYLKQFTKFDKHFGNLTDKLDDDVNVIIYADHGMTFGEGVEIDQSIDRMVGYNLKLYSYPSLYLKKPEKAGFFAEHVVKHTEIDFAFYTHHKDQVIGFHKDGEIKFNKDREKVAINYEYTGRDVLGFYDDGYNGEYLNRDEWLEFSHHLEYPMAPINIFYFLENPVSGDVITLFEENKFPKTNYGSAGNHGGFTWQDMTVPLLFRGPDVDILKNRSYYWLPDLFVDLHEVEFERPLPRERHFIGSRYDFKRKRSVTDISFSPKYRIHYGISAYGSDFSDFDRVDFWGKADLFRSYLSRFWVGAGVEIQDSKSNPFLLVNYDIHIRKFVFQNSYATNRQYYFRMAYEATPWLAFTSVNFNSLGIRLDF